MIWSPTIESVEDHLQSAVVVVSRQDQSVDVTARAAEDIPPGNIYVSRDDFVALWRLAEHVGELNPADWYVAA